MQIHASYECMAYFVKNNGICGDFGGLLCGQFGALTVKNNILFRSEFSKLLSHEGAPNLYTMAVEMSLSYA